MRTFLVKIRKGGRVLSTAAWTLYVRVALTQTGGQGETYLRNEKKQAILYTHIRTFTRGGIYRQHSTSTKGLAQWPKARSTYKCRLYFSCSSKEATASPELWPRGTDTHPPDVTGTTEMSKTHLRKSVTLRQKTRVKTDRQTDSNTVLKAEVHHGKKKKKTVSPF